MKGDNAQPLQWTASSLGVLHEGAEAYLTGIFKNAYLCTLHARRKMLLPRDIDLVRRIRGDDMYIHCLIQLNNLMKGQGNVYEPSSRACENDLWYILARKVDSSLIWLGQG